MKKTARIILICLGLIPLSIPGISMELKQNKKITVNSVPFVGAQVFIEPGQTKEEISNWFRLMSEHKMSACRIRMFESYMRDTAYNWDFELFDIAFQAAEKYGVRIWATLYPVTGDNINIGGDKFPESIEKQESIARYIEKTVNHFKTSEALEGWVIINEPGVRGVIPENDFTSKRFNEWEKEQRFPSFTAGGYPVLMDFKKERFLVDYTTWFLQWLSDEIKKYDASHDLHVNNHDIFVNCAEFNFPEWRSFLTSLGGSAHASWHFGYFERDQYAVAMSADCEMLLSGAGNLPWFMTEVQGGNNTYSGFAPLCPTAEEISQWLWITFGAGGKGAIFWTLNPRSTGIEAGEWGMLDFQDQPTDRFVSAGKVAEVVNGHSELFAGAKKADSHIHILYSRESLWAEKQMTIWEAPYEARQQGAVMKSVLAWFEAFGEMGLNPNLLAMNEFDYSKQSYAGETIILSHQLSLPSSYVDSLESFVSRGGKLLVDGLTAYFDEHLHMTMKTGFDFEGLFGGNVSEFKLHKDLYQTKLEGVTLSAHMLKGVVTANSGIPIKNEVGEEVGIRNQFGDGEVVWIPSMIGLGSRLQVDYSGLQEFIRKELDQSIRAQSARFIKPQEKVLMKTLRSGDSLITILINKNENARRVELVFNQEVSGHEILYSEYELTITGKEILLQPEETKVILWK
jgi:beta-galactosidase